MRTLTTGGWALVLLVLMLGCPLALPTLGSAAGGGEVVVYSARIEQLIQPMFDAFTAKTGIKVKTFSASEAELFERLKAEEARTPADVLMTVDVGNLWLAQQAGLLQEFGSPVIEKNIPAHLRAKHNEWVGLSVRARTIAYSTERVKPGELSTYEALGDPRWRGRLGLRTSKKVYNQSMVATMIKTLGESRTEEVLRGWMANEPRIFSSDTKLLEAIAAGQCDVGLVNTYYLAQLKAKEPSLPVALFWPNQQDRGVHVNISGAGVTRYAKHRAEAIRLIEFLSLPETQNLYADVNYEYPANPHVKPNALLAGWGTFKADQVDVAAAGEYQAAAVKLMDRVGWK
ncbi:MAG TPA: extracellular solute-binding protein [Methylomirabilota bacterium]|jgi:iron(III) transport system substrate-binding protein|nr:extracellular solute-binding protein [Methylomirabilota bacterium]